MVSPQAPLSRASSWARRTWPRIWDSPRTMRVEACGDAQEVADRFEPGEGVGVAGMRGEVDALRLHDETADVHLGGAVVGREAVELRPVAGREQDRFREDPLASGAGERGLDLALVEGHALAHFERRRAVVEADDDQIHLDARAPSRRSARMATRTRETA